MTFSSKILHITYQINCAVPENIHTSPTEGIGWAVGDSVRPKNLKKYMWSLTGISRGARGSYKKSLQWERYGYFLELHIVYH